MPKIFKFQQQMFSDFEQIIETEIEKQRAKQSDEGGENPVDVESTKGFFESFSKMWDFPDWYGTWSIISGILILFVSAFYLLASIRLLQIKPSAISLFYGAAGSKIALSILMTAVALSAMSFIGIVMLFGAVFGIVIDIVLIIVVASGNKAAFYSQIPPPLPRTA